MLLCSRCAGMVSWGCCGNDSGKSKLLLLSLFDLMRWDLLFDHPLLSFRVELRNYKPVLLFFATNLENYCFCFSFHRGPRKHSVCFRCS